MRKLHNTLSLEELSMDAPVLKTADVNKYAFYGFASFLATMVPGSYLQLFMTDRLLISAAVVASILTIGRVVDFFVCAVTGGIMEKTRLKWGKYRSWVVVLRWVILASMIGMFLNTTSIPLGARAAICLIAYLGMNLSMNFIGTSTFGILALLAGPSMENRNKLSIRSSQWMVAGQILISATAIPFLGLMTPKLGEVNAYTALAAAAAVIFFIGMTVLGNVAKPYDRPEVTDGIPGAPPVSVGDMAKAVVTNGQLLVYLMAQVLLMAGAFGIAPIAAYYFIYVLGNFSLMAVAMTITTLFSLLAAIVGPKIGIKLGKKRAMITGLLIAVVASGGIAFFGHNGLPVYVVLMCFMMIGNYMYVGFGINYILDCGEYGFWKSGQDNRTVLMSMFNLPMKLGILVGGAIGGFGLAAIGYKAGEDPMLIPGFAKNFMLILGGIPAIFYAIAALIMSVGYKITDADAAKYAKENAERVAAQMGQPAAN
jgi:GPH family glycoside/pentoside/hexuronide:cation symporter